MAQVDYKHPTMTIYMDPHSLTTHWILLILAEKVIEPNIVFVTSDHQPKELAKINPQGLLPFLVDQEGVVLYVPSIIVEYLEDRFPHPQLLPVYPSVRAKCKQVMYQVAQGWYGLMKSIEAGKKESLALLEKNLLNFVPVFKPYFLSEEMTLVDSCLAPVLWKLKRLNIDITSQVAALAEYENRLLTSKSFQDSLVQLNIEDS